MALRSTEETLKKGRGSLAKIGSVKKKLTGTKENSFLVEIRKANSSSFIENQA